MVVDTRVKQSLNWCDEVCYAFSENQFGNYLGNYQNSTGCNFFSIPSQSSLDAAKALDVVKRIAGTLLDGETSLTPADFNDADHGFCVFVPMLIECKDYIMQVVDDAHGLRVEMHDMCVGHRMAQCDVLLLGERLALMTKTMEYVYALNPFLMRFDNDAAVKPPVDDNENVQAGVWRTTANGVHVVVHTERFGSAFVRFTVSRPVDKHSAWKVTTYAGVGSFMIEVEPHDLCRALRFSAPWQTQAERKAARDWICSLLACFRRARLVERRLRWLMGDEAVDEAIAPLCTLSGCTVYRRSLCTNWLLVTGTDVDDAVADVAKAVAAERLGLVKSYQDVADNPLAKCVPVGNDGVLVKVDKQEHVFVDTQWARVAVDECVQRGLYAPWLVKRAQRLRHDAEAVQKAMHELIG